jgi:hypothetical protein
LALDAAEPGLAAAEALSGPPPGGWPAETVRRLVLAATGDPAAADRAFCAAREAQWAAADEAAG